VAQRVGRGIALLFHDCGTRRGWVVSSTPRPQFTPGKEPVPILQDAGWAPGSVWTGGKSRPHRDSIPDRPARSQSLYRLSHPAHIILQYNVIILPTVLQLPTVFNTVTCCTGLQPEAIGYTIQVCVSTLYDVRPSTHFLERNPVVKQHMSVLTSNLNAYVTLQLCTWYGVSIRSGRWGIWPHLG